MSPRNKGKKSCGLTFCEEILCIVTEFAHSGGSLGGFGWWEARSKLLSSSPYRHEISTHSGV